MLVKILIIITLFAYSMLISQPFMSMLVLKRTQLTLGASSYIEFRHIIDAAFRDNFKYVVYLTLITNLLLLIISSSDIKSLLFITSAISFLALIVDIIVMLKGNMPINNMINQWTIRDYPIDWQVHRAAWFKWLAIRQIASTAGWISLLIGVVFK